MMALILMSNKYHQLCLLWIWRKMIRIWPGAKRVAPKRASQQYRRQLQQSEMSRIISRRATKQQQRTNKINNQKTWRNRNRKIRNRAQDSKHQCQEMNKIQVLGIKNYQFSKRSSRSRRMIPKRSRKKQRTPTKSASRALRLSSSLFNIGWKQMSTRSLYQRSQS